MNRLDKLNLLKSKPYYSTLFSKLSNKQINQMEDIVSEHIMLESGPYESAMDRYFLGRDKPKKWTIMLELLVACK